MRIPHHVSFALLLLLGAGCRQRLAPVTPVLPRTALAEEHCWWAVVRSPLHPDAVGERFAAAFASVGLTNVRRSQLGDTVVVGAGPSAWAGAGSGRVESRVVAYPRGDSTHLRHFVAFDDSTNPPLMALCTDITRAAGVGAVAPREPTGEETLAVWRRRPSSDAPRP